MQRTNNTHKIGSCHAGRVKRRIRYRNQAVQINRRPSRSQVRDAYDTVYRQMLKQERRGNVDAARAIESMIEGFSREIQVNDGKCIAVSQIGYDGALKQRWVRIDDVSGAMKTDSGTMVYFYDGTSMLVDEPVSSILTRIKQRNGDK